MTSWLFEDWAPVQADWSSASPGESQFDTMEYHVDLGCGRVKKARIGVDRYAAPGVNVVMDFETGRVYWKSRRPNEDAPLLPFGPADAWDDTHPNPVVAHRLPFLDSSIESVYTHHCFEHLSPPALVAAMNDVYRVLIPGGVLRIVTPLFPSRPAVEDPTHYSLITEGTWDAFCGFPDNMWTDGFAHPYTTARFKMVEKIVSPPTPPERHWGDHDVREIRVAMRARKEGYR